MVTRTRYRDAEDEKPEGPVTEERAPRRTAAPTRSTEYSKPKQQSGDSEFVNITGLFPSKSGKADTAFVKDDIFEKLQEIQPGDTIGVSMNTKTKRLQLWYVQKG